MSAPKRTRSGYGSPSSVKPAGLWGWPSGIVPMRRAEPCGSLCRQIIGNAHCATVITGRVMPTSCRRNVCDRSAKTLAKLPISNGLTIRYANDAPTWFGRRCRLANASKSMNAEFDCLLIITMQHYQFKLNHYPFAKEASVDLARAQFIARVCFGFLAVVLLGRTTRRHERNQVGLTVGLMICEHRVLSFCKNR
jgi:hypothetical protein